MSYLYKIPNGSYYIGVKIDYRNIDISHAKKTTHTVFYDEADVLPRTNKLYRQILEHRFPALANAVYDALIREHWLFILPMNEKDFHLILFHDNVVEKIEK